MPSATVQLDPPLNTTRLSPSQTNARYPPEALNNCGGLPSSPKTYALPKLPFTPSARDNFSTPRANSNPRPIPPSPKTTINVTRREYKFKGTNIKWFAYRSASDGRLDYPDTQPTEAPPKLGDVYIHADLAASCVEVVPQIWQYKKDDKGTPLWIEVTELYELDNGVLRHPLYTDRVLQKRTSEGCEPDYITYDSFCRKVKKRTERAGQLVRAMSDEAVKEEGQLLSSASRIGSSS